VNGENDPRWEGIPFHHAAPQTVEAKNYDPDQQCSYSRLVTEERGTDIFQMLEVRDLGVLLLTSGVMGFNGLSIFTDSEIGHKR
jgi:hypothetical protein